VLFDVSGEGYAIMATINLLQFVSAIKRPLFW